jgi:UDP-glucuronate decarboxylase
VDDLVEGCLRLIRSPAAVTGPVNLGNPAEITMGELAQLVLELTGSGSRLVHRPLPVDDPRRRKPDIGRARRELAWSPRTPLRAGLLRTIESFASRLRTGESAAVADA